jgi:hypothetical protein
LSEVNNKKLTVYQIFHENGNMGKILPQYLSEWTTERVKEEGVCVMPQAQIKSAEVHEKRLKLNLMDGNSIVVDHVSADCDKSLDSAEAQIQSNLRVFLTLSVVFY